MIKVLVFKVIREGNDFFATQDLLHFLRSDGSDSTYRIISLYIFKNNYKLTSPSILTILSSICNLSSQNNSIAFGNALCSHTKIL